MPLLTPDLLQKLREVVAKHHAAFVARAFGVEALPKETVAALREAKLLPAEPIKAVEDAYLYGHVAARLGEGAEDWSQERLRRHLRDNPVPLTEPEKAAVQAANATAGMYVQGLGGEVSKETGQLVIDADRKLRELQAVRDATAANIAARDTVKQLKTDLGWAARDWARNLDRVAVAEKHNAMQLGEVDYIRKKHGESARVAIVPSPDCCPKCFDLYIGPDGHPRIFKLSQLGGPGANVGRKQANWVPCIGSTHPFCGCRVKHIPDGWGFDEDGSLRPGAEGGVSYEGPSGPEGMLKAFAREHQHQDDLRKARKLAGRLKFRGLNVSVESDKGDERHWKDDWTGESGTTVMRVPYGYIRGTLGTDGDHVDCFVGPNPDADRVFIVHQRKKLGPGKFGGYDEDKCMLGFSSAGEAKAAYLAHYDDPGFFGSMSEMPFDEFREKVRDDDHKGEALLGGLAGLPEASMAPPPMLLVIPLRKGAEVTKKRQETLHGLPINVEFDAGDKRTGKNRHGQEWERTMHHTYGEIAGTRGLDGDPVDAYVGPHPDATHAHVITQAKKHADGSFSGVDEEKVMLGFRTPAEAKAGYLKHMNDDRFFGGMESVPMSEFRDRLKTPGAVGESHPGETRKLKLTGLQKDAFDTFVSQRVDDEAPEDDLDEQGLQAAHAAYSNGTLTVHHGNAEEVARGLSDASDSAHDSEAGTHGRALDQVREKLMDMRRAADARKRTGGASRLGPYIGPRGGKWADAAHTKHYELAKNTGPRLLLSKAYSGGPFIGPRGGKWADPERTIPWHEPGAGRPAAQLTVSPDKKPQARERPKPTPVKAAAGPRRWIGSVTEVGLPKDTREAHQQGGQYTPERQKLHEHIYKKFLDPVPSVPAGKKPVAIVMMGGSGSGKGTILKHVMGGGAFHDFVNVNPDDVKEEIPEYQKALGLGTPEAPVSARDAAAMAHEESSDVAEEVRKRAVAGRKNLVLDGTGKNAQKYGAKIQELRDAGYHVRLFMPHIDMDEARKRVKERADHSGRYVPDAFVEEAHHVIPGNFEPLTKYADEAVLFDNSKPPPRPVWTLSDRGQQSKVIDPGFVDAFKKNAEEKRAAAKGRGWVKSQRQRFLMGPESKGVGEPSISLDELLERMGKNQGEAPDNATGLEDAEDVSKWRSTISGHGEPMTKAGGPYIGPRGGKWADPEHKIPWHEPAQRPKTLQPMSPTERAEAEDIGSGLPGADWRPIEHHEKVRSSFSRRMADDADEAVRDAHDWLANGGVGAPKDSSDAHHEASLNFGHAASLWHKVKRLHPEGSPEHEYALGEALRNEAHQNVHSKYGGPLGGSGGHAWAAAQDAERSGKAPEPQVVASKPQPAGSAKIAGPDGSAREAPIVHRTGQYVVHRSAHQRNKHTVTHEPSGMAVFHGNKAEAVQAAKHMHAQAPEAGHDVKFGERPSEADMATLSAARQGLKKSQPGLHIPADQATTSVTTDGAVHGGVGGVNLQVGAPPRPTGGEHDPAGMHEWLRQVQPVTTMIRRDPHIYEMEEPDPDKTFPVDLETGVQATVDDHPNTNRVPDGTFERQALMTSGLPRNEMNPGWEPHSGRLPDEPQEPVRRKKAPPRRRTPRV